jgi:anthranilate synthase component II
MRPRVVARRASRPFRALLPSPGATCYKGRRPLRGIEVTRRKALKMFILIDNYDSFTYNLYHFLGELGASIEVRRNDQLSAADVMAMRPQGIILSPGPCDPDRAGICLDLIKTAAGKLPILGVCLGHQAIGQAFGGRVVRAALPMHGKLSSLKHSGEGIFEDIPNPFAATRYHSLTIERVSLPDCLVSTAETEDGVMMGLAHRDLPIYGVQFHPESIASEHGHRLLGNFLRRAGHNVKPVIRQRHNVKAVA